MAKQPNAKKGLFRCAAIGAAFLCILTLYLIRLTSMQLTNPRSTVTVNGEQVAVTARTVPIAAARGIIRDRRGTPLVRNELHYQLHLDADAFPADDMQINAMLVSLLHLFEGQESLLEPPSFPMDAGFADGRYLYFLHTDRISASARTRYEAYLEELGLPADTDADTLLDAMFSRYHLRTEPDPDAADSKGEMLYDPHLAYRIAAIRYDLEVLDSAEPFLLCEDTPISLITPIREQNLHGVDFQVCSERIYCYPGYASHILGRTGQIQPDRLDYYTALGYPLDAIVGIDGIEALCEEQLRGTDGEMIIEEDQDGNIVRKTITKEAKAGQDVYLTLQMDLQIAAEDALKENILSIVENAISSGEPLSGEDAKAGALVVADPHSGEIFASASYPTFDLSDYSEQYPALSADETSPLLNRALMGLYAPGSTFKVGVAAAAMEAGIIEPDTKIETKGIYTYYEDYQPRCWLYTRTGRNHGSINVVDALRDSCNYFFFDVGRRLGIEAMADYMSQLGLGQKTGVELPESAGILSSPAYTKTKKIPWTGAATLQTAIGQAYNAYTPMQLTSYLSTIVNGGTRFRMHYLLGVTDPGDESVPKGSREILNTVPLSDTTHDTLITAMREVAENGSATRIFRGYGIPVGAKTGTAEVGDEHSAHAVFAAFAPADDPDLIAVSVIENGANGTSAGLCVRDVFDAYFSQN